MKDDPATLGDRRAAAALLEGVVTPTPLPAPPDVKAMLGGRPRLGTKDRPLRWAHAAPRAVVGRAVILTGHTPVKSHPIASAIAGGHIDPALYGPACGTHTYFNGSSQT